MPTISFRISEEQKRALLRYGPLSSSIRDALRLYLDTKRSEQLLRKLQELIAHTKTRLASYKAPRSVRFVDSIGRAPTGKVDYARHSTETAEWARVALQRMLAIT